MTSEPTDFHFHIEGDPPVLHAFGDIDLLSSDAFAEALASCRGSAPAVVDLSGVSFLDSSGLTALVTAAVADGGLTVRKPSGIVRRVIEATGLSELLQVEP